MDKGTGKTRRTGGSKDRKLHRKKPDNILLFKRRPENKRPIKAVFAEALCLVDEEGMTRAQLSLGRDGSPCLMLTDNKHRKALCIHAHPDGGAAIDFIRPDGDIGVMISLSDDGWPSIAFFKQGSDEAIWAAAPPRY
jgi:hypothetical protein